MSREQSLRGPELCRRELRKACAERNRSAVYYWALQIRDNRGWLKRYREGREAEGQPPGSGADFQGS
jgi:hypothetical protein